MAFCIATVELLFDGFTRFPNKKHSRRINLIYKFVSKIREMNVAFKGILDNDRFADNSRSFDWRRKMISFLCALACFTGGGGNGSKKTSANTVKLTF